MLVHLILQFIKHHHIVQCQRGAVGLAWNFCEQSLQKALEISDVDDSGKSRIIRILRSWCVAFQNSVVPSVLNCGSLLFRCTLHDLDALGFALPFGQTVIYNLLIYQQKEKSFNLLLNAVSINISFYDYSSPPVFIRNITGPLASTFNYNHFFSWDVSFHFVGCYFASIILISSQPKHLLPAMMQVMLCGQQLLLMSRLFVTVRVWTKFQKKTHFLCSFLVVMILQGL